MVAFLVLVISVCTSVLFLSCSQPSPLPSVPAEPTLGFDNPMTVVFGGGSPNSEWKDHQDQLRVRLEAFDEELVTPHPVHLDQAYELMFLPVVESIKDEDCTVKTYVEELGQSEKIVDIAPPVFLKSQKLSGQDRFQKLQQTRSVDLSAYEGRNVSIKWQLSGCGDADSAGLARLRLRPKVHPQNSRPHIVFVCSDTHRYDHAFGESGKRLMPKLNEFGKQAVTFSQAFSQASWTLPAVASSLTGLLPRYHKTGELIESGRQSEWEKGRELPQGQFRTGWNGGYYIFRAYPNELQTLPERLRRAGYVTALVSGSYFYAMSGLSTDGPDFAYDTGIIPGDLINDSAIRLLDVLTEEGAPVFLLVHYMDVHEYQKWYPEEVPPARDDQDGTTRNVARYERRVADVDRFLHELFEHLQQKIDLSKTLIAFYSDHGEDLELGTHGHSMDDTLLHIPLLVSFPDDAGIAPGEVKHPVGLADLYWTALDSAGLTTDNAGQEATSLSTLAKAKETSERFIFSDYQLYGDEQSSVRSSRFKLVLNFTKNAEELFALPQPSVKSDDLQAKMVMQRVFDDYVDMAETFSEDLVSDQSVDLEELDQRLRALGYIN